MLVESSWSKGAICRAKATSLGVFQEGQKSRDDVRQMRRLFCGGIDNHDWSSGRSSGVQQEFWQRMAQAARLN